MYKLTATAIMHPSPNSLKEDYGEKLHRQPLQQNLPNRKEILHGSCNVGSNRKSSERKRSTKRRKRKQS